MVRKAGGFANITLLYIIVRTPPLHPLIGLITTFLNAIRCPLMIIYLRNGVIKTKKAVAERKHSKKRYRSSAKIAGFQCQHILCTLSQKRIPT